MRRQGFKIVPALKGPGSIEARQWCGVARDAPAIVKEMIREDFTRIQSAVVGAFPNVTVIHIRDVMDKVLVVLERIALAVRALR